MNPAPVALRRNELFVGILHRDRTALHVVEGDRKTLRQIAGCINRIPGVVTNLFKESKHRREPGKG